MFDPITESRKAKPQYMAQANEQHPIRLANALLSEGHLPQILNRLPTLVNVPQPYYQALYLKAIENFAEYVQRLPAVGSVAYTHAGGFLECNLELAFLTMHLFRKDQPIDDLPPEEIPAKTALWCYALFTAALLAGIGKISANYWITLCDNKGNKGFTWNPFDGSMVEAKKQNTDYRFSLNTAVNRDWLAANETLFIARQILPPEGFNWLASDKDIFEAWLGSLQNDERRGRVISKIVLYAYIQLLSPNRSVSEILRLLIRDGLIRADVLDIKKPTKAETSPKSPTNPASSFDFNNFNSVEIGKVFKNWLSMGIKDGSIAFNKGNDGPVNVAPGGKVLVSMELLQKFVNENARYQKNAQEVLRNLIQQGYALGEIAARNSYLESTGATPAKLMGGLPTSAAPTTPARKTFAMDPSGLFPEEQIPAPPMNFNPPTTTDKNLPPLPPQPSTAPAPRRPLA